MLTNHKRILTFRALLLIATLCLYFIDPESLNFTAALPAPLASAFLWLVWVIFITEMLFRLFPNKCVPIGARKHFASSYNAAPVSETSELKVSNTGAKLHKGAALSGLAWLVSSAGIFYVLFLTDMLSPGTVFLAALVYSILDVVFILFFCPFQKLFMQNHCCAVCRIYNWDYFMMFAPLILFPSFYSVSLALLSLAVLLRWEISVQKNPHFFMRETNVNLRCESCGDEVCRQKSLK